MKGEMFYSVPKCCIDIQGVLSDIQSAHLNTITNLEFTG
jgi:hypothetical protein